MKQYFTNVPGPEPALLKIRELYCDSGYVVLTLSHTAHLETSETRGGEDSSPPYKTASTRASDTAENDWRGALHYGPW